MAIVKTHDYVEFYRYLANTSGLHQLSGRGNENAATEHANARILHGLQLTPDDTLLDIGCGDGCLLQMAGPKIRAVLGVVPNIEECEKIAAARPGLAVKVGRAQRLPVESGSFSKIACNSVVSLLESRSEVAAALKEMARAAQPGALIWVGELPSADELAEFGKYTGNSIFGFLAFELRKGARQFVAALRSVISASLGRSMMALNASRIFYAPPEEFIRMAESCGLRYVSHFKYKRLDRSGELIESPFRYNYIFSK